MHMKRRGPTSFYARVVAAWLSLACLEVHSETAALSRRHIRVDDDRLPHGRCQVDSSHAESRCAVGGGSEWQPHQEHVLHQRSATLLQRDPRPAAPESLPYNSRQELDQLRQSTGLENAVLLQSGAARPKNSNYLYVMFAFLVLPIMAVLGIMAASSQAEPLSATAPEPFVQYKRRQQSREQSCCQLPSQPNLNGNIHPKSQVASCGQLPSQPNLNGNIHLKSQVASCGQLPSQHNLNGYTYPGSHASLVGSSCMSLPQPRAPPTIPDVYAATSGSSGFSSQASSQADLEQYMAAARYPQASSQANMDQYMAAARYPLTSVVSCGLATLPDLPSRMQLPAAPAPQAVPSSRQHLCPKLVVPHGMEFVFAVREVIYRERQQTSFSIVDLTGNPLCYVMARELNNSPSSCGIYLELLSKEPLAHVRTHMSHEGLGQLEICSPDGEVFCRVEPDVRGESGFQHQTRYVLRDPSGVQLAAYHGDFKNKAVNCTAPSGALVCATRRCTIEGDNSPYAPYYEVRVAPYADAGLLLCGLLAIDKLERGC